MRICIISDSHDRAEPLATAVKLAQAAGAQAVIHCGDLIGANMKQIRDIVESAYDHGAG